MSSSLRCCCVLFRHRVCLLLSALSFLSVMQAQSSQVNDTEALVLLNETTTKASINADLVVHPAWDKHIKDLEHLLEVDLARVELDAKDAASIVLAPNGTTLADDLLRVRQDIDRLVSSVKEVEDELGKTKHKIDEEERDIALKNAEIETEKFLDGLHRGKLNMKVDYITGQLVPKPKSLKRRSRRKRLNAIKASQADEPMTNSTTRSYVTSDPLRRPPMVATEGFDEVVAAAASNTDDDEFLEQKRRASETVRQHIESHPDLQTRIKEEMEFLKTGSDPAVLFMDIKLMLDIVKLAMTASVFGLAAVFLKLPPTAGFLLGGMIIGPSCFDVVGEIHQVQTLAQFGAIFLLFEQGLLYSQTYSGETLHSIHESSSSQVVDTGDIGKLDPTTGSRDETSVHSRRGHPMKSTAQPPESSLHDTQRFLTGDEHDPNVVGSIILILLVFVTLAVVVFTGVANSFSEATMVSCTIALCSTTIVAETLQAAHIADTHWGVGVLKMIAMHDLFMVPLLALPELLSSLMKVTNNDDDGFNSVALLSLTTVFGKLALVAIFLKGSTFLATHIIRAASKADARLTNAKGELFTLSVVAYALLIATASDELSMSIEAGAVLAGIALFRSPFVPKVLSSIQPITSVFGGMYMTSLGMIISPGFVANEASHIFELVCLIGFFKFALVSVVLNRLFDYGITSSIAVGSAMAQISEVSLLILAKCQRMGLIRRKTYLLLIPTTCIMLALAPLSAALLRRLPKVQDHESVDELPLCFLRKYHILRPRSMKKRRIYHHASETMEEGKSRIAT